MRDTRGSECNAKTALQRTSRCVTARSTQRDRAVVVDVSRRPARETILFAVALVALAIAVLTYLVVLR